MKKVLLVITFFTLTTISLQAQTGAALNFDGSNDYVQIPNVISTASAFTIEFWMKTTQTGPSSGSQWYNGIGLVDGEMPGQHNDFGVSLINSHVAFGIGNPDITIIASPDVSTGTWVHVAAAWDGTAGTMSLYINGVLENYLASGVPTASRNYTTDIKIGVLQTQVNGYYNGNIDEVRIWNVARTQAEIQSDMNVSVSSATSLVASYNFNDGIPDGNNTSITTVADGTGNGNNGSLNNFALTGSSSNFVGNVIYKWYVTPGASGDGISWSDPADFQTAVNEANSLDSVFVEAGTYQPASGASFSMKEGVKIYGGFAGTETSLAERDLSAGNTTTLEGNGNTTLYNNNNGLTNAALLDGFTITGGSGTNGYGGGLENDYASPTIENCIVSGNTADQYGGGVQNYYASPVMINCLITGNTAANYGAGIYNLSDCDPELINCTIAGNSSGTAGGGMYSQDNSLPVVTNCIVYGNSSGIGSDGTAGSDANVSYSLVQGITGGTGNIDGSTDPQFVSPSASTAPFNDGNYQLQASSPVINQGSNAAVPSGITTDLIGAARIYNSGTVDMGAYEYQGAALPLTLLNFMAQKQEQNVLAQWQTADEINTDYFEVERSSDGQQFNAINTIPARGGNSNTYSMLDVLTSKNVAAINNSLFYRLKMVDKDGKFSYSQIVQVKFDGQDNLLDVYPNPSVNTVHIHANTSSLMKLYNAEGQLIKSQMLSPGDNLLNVSGMAQGIYFITVQRQQVKLIIQ